MFIRIHTYIQTVLFISEKIQSHFQKTAKQEGKNSIFGFRVNVIFDKISPRVFFLAANDICQKELGGNVVAEIFLLGYASFHKFIPLDENSILAALKKIVPEKFLETNLKAFALAKKEFPAK